MAILLEELLLPDAAAWRAWLHENHQSHPGVRLVLHKKGGTTTGLTYAQAVDEALCFGWIDGQRSRRDEHSHLQPLHPACSTQQVVGEECGQHRKARRPGVDGTGRASRRWMRRRPTVAGRRPTRGRRTATLPEDFLAALVGHPLAQEKLETLGAAERYAIYYRLHTVKGAETRRKKIAGYIARLDAGQGIF